MQDRVDYKSQYGYVIMWFGGPLCWISKEHNHVGESSAVYGSEPLLQKGQMAKR
jgi:hypothetical protein